MRRWNKNFGRKLTAADRQRYARFLIIPTVVLILVLVIALYDKTSRETEVGAEIATSEETVSETLPETLDETESQEVIAQKPVRNIEDYQLKKDEMPELTALVEDYCQAKTDCDPITLNSIFGRLDLNEGELAEERTKMEFVSEMVDGYGNMACYYIEGPEADTYVLYPYFEIQYKHADTWMPSLTWCYAVKGEDGQFYMTQDVDDSVKEYIAKISLREDVRALISEVDEKSREAIASDDELKRIYEGTTAAGGDDGTGETSAGSVVEIVPLEETKEVTSEAESQTLQ